MKRIDCPCVMYAKRESDEEEPGQVSFLMFDKVDIIGEDDWNIDRNPMTRDCLSYGLNNVGFCLI